MALLLFTAHVSAQSVLGRIGGTVLDASGGVLPGATVTLTNVSTNQVATTVASSAGAFSFPQVPAGTYKIVVELQGFKTSTYNQVAVNVGQEYSLTAKLELGEISETVEVTAGLSLVKTTTPEVSSTVQQKEVLSLPLAGRDVTGLIKLQAGVPGIATRSNTAIDGGRPTWTQVTQDGINVQDNFIRTNSLDFLPNRPTSDNVAEFSVTTSVSGADSAGGATSVRMVTPSGTNTFRGSAFYANRNWKLSANSFFNNKSGVPKPYLNRNQFGGTLGGPIQKNKLFFYGYYEGFRQQQQQAQNNTIPANADWASGVFRYAATDGTVRSINVLQQVGLPVDAKMQSLILSKMPSVSSVNNFDVGDSRSDRVLNTAGYRFNQQRETNRNYFGTRFDYELSSRHRFEVVFSRLTDVDDRPDLDLITLPRPLVYTSATTKRFVAAWRWLATSRFQNEVRGGFNLAPVGFFS
ncbi:MAG: carboxypeptidase-like regulatory domain-containing protein, partial [Acidobacteria bacterium]|nr:carboxypeptidase-like regulatory domain-containing protein [Acidobacteriota bacterium]